MALFKNRKKKAGPTVRDTQQALKDRAMTLGYGGIHLGMTAQEVDAALSEGTQLITEDLEYRTGGWGNLIREPGARKLRTVIAGIQFDIFLHYTTPKGEDDGQPHYQGQPVLRMIELSRMVLADTPAAHQEYVQMAEAITSTIPRWYTKEYRGAGTPISQTVYTSGNARRTVTLTHDTTGRRWTYITVTIEEATFRERIDLADATAKEATQESAVNLFK